MKASFAYLKSFAIIYAFLLAGSAVVELAHLPIPGSIVGMVLLTIALYRGYVSLQAVEPSAGVLVKHMAFFFVPPGVGLILYFDLLKDEWLAITLAGVIGTFAVLATVALLQQRMETDG
jgi:holin-like protein